MSKQSRQAKAVAEKYGIDTRLTWDKIKKNFYQYRGIYLMLIPVLAFYIVFNYAPLQGLQIAFRNYRPGRGIWGSAWVGLANFKQFSPAHILACFAQYPVHQLLYYRYLLPSPYFVCTDAE